MNIFKFNEFSPDFVGPVFIDNSKFVNLDLRALTFMENPP